WAVVVAALGRVLAQQRLHVGEQRRLAHPMGPEIPEPLQRNRQADHAERDQQPEHPPRATQSQAQKSSREVHLLVVSFSYPVWRLGSPLLSECQRPMDVIDSPSIVTRDRK